MSPKLLVERENLQLRASLAEQQAAFAVSQSLLAKREGNGRDKTHALMNEMRRGLLTARTWLA